MSYDSPYVVGAYSGGGGVPDVFGQVPGAYRLAYAIGTTSANAGALIVVLVLFVAMWFMGWGLFRRSGMELSNGAYISGGTYVPHHMTLPFAAGPSDYLSNAQGDNRRIGGVVVGGDQTSSFMNSREPPYFPDVSNRILRMENREQEAIRALNKINQVRMSRGGDDSAPLPWGPFWSEWQATHGNDDDGYMEGMGVRNDTGGYYR